MGDVCSSPESQFGLENACSQPIQDCCSAEMGHGIIQSKHRSPDLADSIARGKVSGPATSELHRASELGNAEEIESILKSEFDSPTPFDINCADIDGDTALHKAARHGHIDICRILCRVKKPSPRREFSMENVQCRE